MEGPQDKAKRIEALAQKYGGWAKILAPDFEPSEEMLCAFEEAGLTRKSFASKRKWWVMSPREREIKHLAGALWSEWSRYLDAERGRDSEAPQNSGKRVIDVPTGFWRAYEPYLVEHQLSQEDIENEILSNPAAYPPLISIWTRALNARAERVRSSPSRNE